MRFQCFARLLDTLWHYTRTSLRSDEEILHRGEHRRRILFPSRRLDFELFGRAMAMFGQKSFEVRQKLASRWGRLKSRQHFLPRRFREQLHDARFASREIGE